MPILPGRHHVEWSRPHGQAVATTACDRASHWPTRTVPGSLSERTAPAGGGRVLRRGFWSLWCRPRIDDRGAVGTTPRPSPFERLLGRVQRGDHGQRRWADIAARRQRHPVGTPAATGVAGKVPGWSLPRDEVDPEAPIGARRYRGHCRPREALAAGALRCLCFTPHAACLPIEGGADPSDTERVRRPSLRRPSWHFTRSLPIA